MVRAIEAQIASRDGDAPKKKWDKPKDGKPAAKGDGPKKRWDKPAVAKDDSAPKKRWDKPKPAGKPDGKAATKVRPGAANTGQRMERPGAKPKGKGKGGDKPPRRK